MTNRFLASLAPEERKCIRHVAAQLTADLKPWAEASAVINPVRLPVVALTVAACAPSWNPALLQLLAKVTFWIFSIDDAIDAEGLPDEVLTSKVASWRTVLEDPLRPTPGGGDEHAALLAEIAAEIAKSPLTKPLYGHWRTNFERMFAGMLFERELGRRFRAEGPAALPPYSTYLSHGLYSIGVPSFASSACLLRAEPGALDRWAAYLVMEQEAGRTLRLANDLRTWQREAQEHNLNALMILQHRYTAAGMPEHAAWERAERVVAQQMARCRARCANMKPLLALAAPETAEALARTVEFAVEFYREHDYHTVPAGMIERL